LKSICSVETIGTDLIYCGYEYTNETESVV